MMSHYIVSLWRDCGNCE